MRYCPLSATGQVTSRGSRRGATAAIKEHGSSPGARDTCAASPCPIATCRTSEEDNPRDLRGARCTRGGEAPLDSARCLRARSSWFTRRRKDRKLASSQVIALGASPSPHHHVTGPMRPASPSLRFTPANWRENPLRSTTTPVGAAPRDVAVSLGLATSVGSRPP